MEFIYQGVFMTSIVDSLVHICLMVSLWGLIKRVEKLEKDKK